MSGTHTRAGDPRGFAGSLTAGLVSRTGRPLLDAGTRVSLRCDGDPLGGVVQPYEPEYSDGTFPVRFDDGIWRTMTVRDVTVVTPPAAPVTPGRTTRDG